MATVNLSLPKITMEELEDDAKLQKILSYLYQMNEQLRYELTHIDDDNISGDGISEVSLTDSVSRTLKNDQGEVLELYMNARRMILELTGKVDESAGSLEAISERMAKVEVNSERIETEVSYIQEAQDATNADITTLTEKVTTVEQTADGLERTISEVQSEVNAVDGSVTQLEERVLEVEETSEGVKETISEVVKRQDDTDGSLETLSEKITTVEKTAEGVKIEVSELSIGDKNLLLNSGEDISSADHLVATYETSTPLEAGKTYTLVMKATPAEGVTYLDAYLSSGYKKQCELKTSGVSESQILTKTFIAAYYDGREPEVNGSYANVRIYRRPNDATVTGETTIHWIKVVEGNKATNDYSPSPEEFHNTAVDINKAGVAIDTTGSIRALVNGSEELTIDKEGVSAKQVVADVVHAGNIVETHGSATADFKGGIQRSIDALPKFLTQDTVLNVPAGAYNEDIVIAGFMGGTLTIHFEAGVTIIGNMEANHCMGIELTADALGDMFIYPQSSVTPVYVRYCQHALLKNLQISGYRKRTSGSGTGNGLYVLESNATVENCCVEYTRNNAIVFQRGTFDCVNCIGGNEGGDFSTNANLGNGVLAYRGAHGSLRNTSMVSANGNVGSNATLLVQSVVQTPGGRDAASEEPEYITKTFTISKHCTYLYGVSRTRDDQSTLLSQGRYGAYTGGENNWRIGAMWFDDAAKELAGKTIQSATLRMRRGSGGWSNPVGIYLGKVALAEADFDTTFKPAFTAAEVYPAGAVKRETEAAFDVTALMTAIQSGQALGVFEPRSEYSGNFSPAYTTIHGKGSSYEPALTVTYK